MTTITLPLSVAKSVASLFAVVDTKKNAYIPLQQVRVQTDGKTLTAYSTDRYALALATYDLAVEQPPVLFGMTLAMAKFIQSHKGTEKVTIDFENNEAKVTVGTTSSLFETNRQTYPDNIVPLVTDYKVGDTLAPVKLDIESLSRIAKIFDRDGNKVTDWVADTAQVADRKSSAIRLTSNGFTVLFQPKVI
jgi:DNA polymerase III sliding clamp (beta) subunit (PCNA family)